MIFRAWRAAGLLLLAAALPLAAQPSPSSGLAPWTFRADFAHGLTGWMSFPLAQDIGFDPSLFTEEQNGRTVLVRQFQPLGRKRLILGVIRPLEFSAEARSRVRIEYELRMAGQVESVELILAGANGHRYSAALSRLPGGHSVELNGLQLGLPPAAAKIQAVILLARIGEPPAEAWERLTVRRIEIHALRQPEVQITEPALNRSEVGQVIVSRRILRPESNLEVHLAGPHAKARVEVSNPRGKFVQRAPVSANGTASVSLGSESTPGFWTAVVTSGPARTEFHFLVLGTAPPHPRILLRPARLEELRSQPRYAHLRRQIHEQAKELAAKITFNSQAGANIAHLPGGTGLHPGFVGELKAYFRLLESYADTISYNALDYALDGDEASFIAAKRALLTVAQWQTWTPPRFTEHGLHTYYEVGVFSQRVALGYDLLAPHLSAGEKKQIADAFWRQIIEPTVREYYLYNRMPLAASNWMANSLGGAIAADVATEGDIPEWQDREGAALGELLEAYQELLRGLFPGDGSEVEPAGYENFAMRGLSWGQAALDALGIRPRGATRMAQGFWWPYYAMVQPGLVLDTGDFDGRLNKLPGFAWGAEHDGIPALRDFYDRSSTHVALSSETDVQHTGRELEQASGPLDLACCTGPAPKYPLPPPSRVFPLRGSAVLRSGWGPDATVISLRAGPWFNHEHHDEGSFQVAAFGHKLIAEAGYSAYYTDPNYPIYFTQAPGHNTVLLDDNPFSQSDYNGPFWAAFSSFPHFTRQLLSKDFDFLTADLAPAYAGRLTSYERDFVFIKPDFLAVRDRLNAASAHVFTWLLHTPADATLSTEAGRATIRVAGASASLLAAGSSADWKEKATPISIIEFDDLDQGVIHTPREFYLESSPEPSAGFLVGMQLSSSDEAPEAMKAIHSAAGEGIVRKGAAPLGVVFRSGKGALQLEDISTDGDVLAVRGASGSGSILAVNARSIERGAQAEFHSEVPITIALQPTATGVEAEISAAAPTQVEFRSVKRPAEVRVDGGRARFTFSGGMVTVPIAEKGEHRVEIVP